MIEEWTTNEWHDVFFGKEMVPSFKTLQHWIEHDLNRDTHDLTELHMHQEVLRLEPIGEWEHNAVGPRRLFEVTFADGYSDSLHVYQNGRICTETADWHAPQGHIEITGLRNILGGKNE